MAQKSQACRICELEAETWAEGPIFTVDCPRCGPYEPVIADGVPLRELLAPNGVSKPNRRTRLSHIVRRQQRDGVERVTVWTKQIEPRLLDEPLPSPAAQLDDLILWIGREQPTYAEFVELDELAVSAWICAPIKAARPHEPLEWLLSRGSDRGFIVTMPDECAQLTMKGWERFQELQRVASTSRVAFMALQFGDSQLDQAIDAFFKPAVASAGFELRKLTDMQPAGLIDDQMRVSLRQARFVIAELTHQNRGAHWEAGFAEGAGKAVIYMCRKDVWDDKDQKPHFDTNHLATIIWDPGNLADAANRLTAMIRATFPSDAKLS